MRVVASSLLWFAAVLAQLRPSIRVRLNKGVFEQASSIVAGLVEYEVPRVQIPSSQQCFSEGCVQIHSFRMTSFRQPQFVSFEPSPPNRFAIRVSDFDFFVAGHLSGSIQVLIHLPVAGTVYVSGRGISVTAYLDLQKTLDDEPYLRFLECKIDGGLVDTRVADMGLFTDTVNSKYRGIMSQQSRAQLEEAICNNMHRLSQQHFSSRLSHLPRVITAKKLLDMLIPASGEIPLAPTGAEARSERGKRAVSEDYYDEIDSRTSKPTVSRPKQPPPQFRIPDIQVDTPVSISAADINNFFNINRLAHILVDLTLLDAYATRQDFAIGMAGDVITTKAPGEYPTKAPFPFRVPQNEQRRQIEVVISNHTINSLLWQAHRTNSLLFHVDSRTPTVGNVLKTTCSLDEVCLSDQIEEVGTMYPGRSLELIIRTTRSPTVRIDYDKLTMDFAGRCLFFLEGTRQKIGVIPFEAIVSVVLKTHGNIIKGHVSIERLTLDEEVDFFKLSASDLDGFRSSVQTAFENTANRILERGIPLSTSHLRLPLRLSAAHIQLLPEVVFLQANVDLYNSLYGN